MRMLFLFYLLTLLACEKPERPPAIIPPPPSTDTSGTWLALGDSYTIGQGVQAADRFPTQTANLLRIAGIPVREPVYIAQTGWTSGMLTSQVETINPGAFDIVSLLIGVNDQYMTHDTTGYRARFTGLLQRAISSCKTGASKVVVVSIPDYSVTPFAAFMDTARIRTEIGWFNQINQAVTLQYNIKYLDITPSTREALYDRTLLADDGLHPSKIEYRKWAVRLAELLR